MARTYIILINISLCPKILMSIIIKNILLSLTSSLFVGNHVNGLYSSHIFLRSKSAQRHSNGHFWKRG